MHYALDFETYYEKKTCSVKLNGAYNYCRHPEFDAYLVSVTDGVDVWVLTKEEFQDFDWKKLHNQTVIAHNASFDMVVFSYLQSIGKLPKGISPKWQCSANLTAYLKVQRNLASASKVLMGIEVSKDVRDKANGMSYADMKSDMEFWKQMIDYSARDVVLCWQLFDQYQDLWPEFEQGLSRHTLEICSRGFPIDTKLLATGIKACEKSLWTLKRKLPWYNEEGNTALSTKLLGVQCRKAGIPCPKSLKEDDEDCIQWEETYGKKFPWVSDMRKVRKLNTLYKRLLAMRARTDENGRCHFGLKYFGAHTGRWSGDAGLNVQNFTKEPVEI